MSDTNSTGDWPLSSQSEAVSYKPLKPVALTVYGLSINQSDMTVLRHRTTAMLIFYLVPNIQILWVA